MHKPFTYLIGWTKHNKWYYGVRYSKNCTPDSLWVTYFTSSKIVKEFRNSNGEPDVVEVRKAFNCPKAAKKWEDKVLRRLDVNKAHKWLNQSNNTFKGVYNSWNIGLTKETSPKLLKVGKSISRAWKNKMNNGYVSLNKNKQRSDEFKRQNSWSQLIKHTPSIATAFLNHDDFIAFCVEKYKQGLGVYTIAELLGMHNGNCIKTQLKFAGIRVKTCQTMSKILKRMPDFPFKQYDEFVKFCNEQIANGYTMTSIARDLKVSQDAVKRAISVHHSKDL